MTTSPQPQSLINRAIGGLAALTIGVTAIVTIAPPANADDTPVPAIIKGTTAQTTQIINPGDPDSVFGDVVTVHAMSLIDESVVDDDTWPVVEGTLVPFVARLTIYKNDTPLTASPSATGTVVTSFTHTFTGPGEWTMTAADLPAGVWEEMRANPAFYSVTTEFLVADQGTNAGLLQGDTLDGYTLPAETVSITSALPDVAITSDGPVLIGDPLAATGTIAGVPAQQAAYQGDVPGFPAAHTFDMSVWEIAEADLANVPPGTNEVPPTATLVKTYSLPLEDGDFTVGGDLTATEESMCYVWHATFSGDSYLAPYSSDFTNVIAHQCPTHPTIHLTALYKYAIPANGNSYEWQYTNAPGHNFFVVTKKVVPVEDDTLPIGEWVCDLSGAEGISVHNSDFPSDDIGLSDDSGVMSWSSEWFAGPGTCILFQAFLIGWAGERLAETSWDDPEARTIIIPPPSVNASVVDRYVTAGSEAQARAEWENVQTDPTVEFYSQTVPVLDTTLPTAEWECDLTQLDDVNAEMVGSPQSPPAPVLSDPVTATKAGTCVIFQALVIDDGDGTVIAESDWDDPDVQAIILPPAPDDQVLAAPTIRAQALDAIVSPGGTAQEKAWHEHAPNGATVEFAFQTVPTIGLSAPMMDGFCDTSKATDAAAQLAGPPTTVRGSNGTVLSTPVTAPTAGTCILFKAILRDKVGKKLAETSWDDPTTQVRVGQPPPVKVNPVAPPNKWLPFTGTSASDLILVACLLLLCGGIAAARRIQHDQYSRHYN